MYGSYTYSGAEGVQVQSALGVKLSMYCPFFLLPLSPHGYKKEGEINEIKELDSCATIPFFFFVFFGSPEKPPLLFSLLFLPGCILNPFLCRQYYYYKQTPTNSINFTSSDKYIIRTSELPYLLRPLRQVCIKQLQK